MARPPVWLKRPAAATFGFGGRLVSINNTKRQDGSFGGCSLTLTQVRMPIIISVILCFWNTHLVDFAGLACIVILPETPVYTAVLT